MHKIHPQVSHAGIYVRDLAAMRDFYVRVMGFLVTDEGVVNNIGYVFLSQSPAEHHQLVIASGRPREDTFNILNQLSFRLASLAELRAFHELLKAEPRVSRIEMVTHGTAWSVYFRDPEENRIEVFTDTPWYVNQPFRFTYDLTRPDAEIIAFTKALVEKQPSYRPFSDWKRELSEKLGVVPAAGFVAGESDLR